MSKYNSEAVNQAKFFLEQHQIEDILADMINSIIHYHISSPIPYMIHFLANAHENKLELQAAGINIEEKPDFPKPILSIGYPNYLKKGQSTFSNSLEKHNFLKCKDNYTKSKATLRQVLAITKEVQEAQLPQYQAHKRCLFMVEPDCYNQFQPLIDPFLKNYKQLWWENGKMNRSQEIDMSLKYCNRVQDVDIYKYANIVKYSPLLDSCIIKVKRNKADTKFSNLLKQNERKQITDELEQWVKSQNFQIYQPDSLPKKLPFPKLFKTFKPRVTKYRYPEYPLNRMAGFKQESVNNDIQTMIWINREDHLYYKSSSSNVIESLIAAWKFSDAFEKQFKSAFSEKYGFLTVKPQDVGLGLKLKFKIKNNTKKLNQKNENPYIKCSSQVFTLNSLLLTDRQSLYAELDKILEQLFQQENMTSDPDQTYNNRKYPQSNEDSHQVLTISQSINEIEQEFPRDVIYPNDLIETTFMVARKKITQPLQLQGFKTNFMKDEEEVARFLRTRGQKMIPVQTYKIEHDKKLFAIFQDKQEVLFIFHVYRQSISQFQNCFNIQLNEFTKQLDMNHIAHSNFTQLSFGCLIKTEEKRLKNSHSFISIQQQEQDEKSQKATKSSEDANKLNQKFFIFLNDMTTSNIEQYCKFVNNIVVTQSYKGGYLFNQLKDYCCSESISSSPDISSYDVFYQLIEAKITSVIKESQLYSRYRDKIMMDLSNEDLFDEVLFLAPIQQINESSIGSSISFIEMHISRNFRAKNYSFNLHQSELEKLSSQISSVLTIENLRDMDITEIKKEILPLVRNSRQRLTSLQTLYTIEVKRKLILKIMACGKNHIQVRFSCTRDDLKRYLKLVANIFRLLQQKISIFAKRKGIGYLGPDYNDCIFSGVSIFLGTRSKLSSTDYAPECQEKLINDDFGECPNIPLQIKGGLWKSKKPIILGIELEYLSKLKEAQSEDEQ